MRGKVSALARELPEIVNVRAGLSVFQRKVYHRSSVGDGPFAGFSEMPSGAARAPGQAM